MALDYLEKTDGDNVLCPPASAKLFCKLISALVHPIYFLPYLR